MKNIEADIKIGRYIFRKNFEALSLEKTILNFIYHKMNLRLNNTIVTQFTNLSL